MAKKPNAANLTHGFAQLGGGSKKEGGGGMLKGVENVFRVGVEYGAQIALNGKQPQKSLEDLMALQLGDGSKDEDE